MTLGVSGVSGRWSRLAKSGWGSVRRRDSGCVGCARSVEFLVDVGRGWLNLVEVG